MHLLEGEKIGKEPGKHWWKRKRLAKSVVLGSATMVSII